MIELKSAKIRKKILNLCDFYEDILKNQELIFRRGNKDELLKEIGSIRGDIASTKTFRLAFVGEYSSGKTSIINILAGRDMPVSTSVETNKSAEVPWNNVTIVDTPGLGSGRPEHDKITKDWLAKADLLVYVVTVDLLTEGGGARLKSMLDKYKRDHEMMLVVNMIDQEGNDVEAYCDDLQLLLDPRPISLFSPVFISSMYQAKSQDSILSPEEQTYYHNKGRFGTFVAALDDFILQRREKAALTTPLTRLQTLSRKIAFKNKFNKECALLDLKIGLYESAIRDTRVAFDDFCSQLKDLATASAGNIFLALDSDTDMKAVVEKETHEYAKDTQRSIEHLGNKAASITSELEKEGTMLDGSELAMEVANRIKSSETLQGIFNTGFSARDVEIKRNEYIKHLRSAFDSKNLKIYDLDFSKDILDVFSSKNVLEAAGKLVGRVNRDFVLKIGHKIGHKFRPWEAVNLATKFGKAVPFVNCGAAALEGVMAIKNKNDEKKAAQALREFKEEIHRFFNQADRRTTDEIEAKLIIPLNASINDGMQMLKDKRLELIEFSEKNRDLARLAESKRDECMAIYEEIYG